MAWTVHNTSKNLSDKVTVLRENIGLTFLAISEQLIAKVYKSPKGKLLSAEIVFSVYKKRKLLNQRLQSQPSLEVNAFLILGNLIIRTEEWRSGTFLFLWQLHAPSFRPSTLDRRHVAHTIHP